MVSDSIGMAVEFMNQAGMNLLMFQAGYEGMPEGMEGFALLNSATFFVPLAFSVSTFSSNPSWIR